MRLDRVARALTGAGSGGVLGLLLAGIAGWLGRGTLTVGWTSLALVGMAAAMGWLNARGPASTPPAAPRALVGMALTAGALLIVLAVYLGQSFHVQGLTAAGKAVNLPLAIWPVSRAALLLSVLAAGAGSLAALLGWAEAARSDGEYTAGRPAMLALLSAGAWAGLALAVYSTGAGLVFAG